MGVIFFDFANQEPAPKLGITRRLCRFELRSTTAPLQTGTQSPRRSAQFNDNGCHCIAQITEKRKSQDNLGYSLTVRTRDGIHTGIIKAKVECTLRQFEDISRRVESNANRGTVTFIPDFAYTQFPSQTSYEFRILFATFVELASHPGIISKADQLELVRKYGMGPQGAIVRLLGSYSFHKKEMSKPARIYLGSSCGSIIEVEKSLSNEEEKVAAQHHYVITRKSIEWNVTDKRFVHDVEMQKLSLPRLSEDTSEEEAFQIQWRRAPDLTTRAWSRALIHDTEVQGWLEVIVPFVQMQGRYLCVEVGGLASDDIWDDILKPKLRAEASNAPHTHPHA